MQAGAGAPEAVAAVTLSPDSGTSHTDTSHPGSSHTGTSHPEESHAADSHAADSHAATSAGPEGEHPLPHLGPDLQALIGHQLRAVYHEVLNEPVPDRFVRLLEALAAKQAGHA
jgi:hypothetical protein